MSTATDAPQLDLQATRVHFGLPSGGVMSATLTDFHMVDNVVASAEQATLAEEDETDPETTTTSDRWKAVLVVEGVRTTDHREVGEDSLTWRDLPLPLMGLKEDSHGGVPMTTSVIVGSIETITRVENRLEASGRFDDGADGAEFQRLVENQMLRWVSADLEVIAEEMIGEPPMLFLFAEDEEDDEDESEDYWFRITEGRLMGATVLAFPALPQCVIVMEEMDWPEVTPDNGLPNEIAASGSMQAPPAAWFEDPDLDGPTHLTVTSDGRVYGHLATWNARHTGYLDRVVNPPRSSPGCPYFNTGSTRTAEGTLVRTGVISLGGGHADGGLRPAAAKAHYDDPATAVCRVRAGEDAHGIWIAGALFPGVSEEQALLLKSLDVSGDWRPIGGRPELIAACVVNVPGFPIPQSIAASGNVSPIGDGRMRATYREGEFVSLVAAGIVRRDPLGDLRREVRALRSFIEPLRPLIVDQLRKRVS